MLLEGQDGQTWKDHVCNHALCHLPNVDGQIDPSLVVVFISLQCMMCGQSLGATTKLICWLVFLMLAYGMLDHAIKENTSKKMVFFFNAPYRFKYLFLWLNNRIILIIHVWSWWFTFGWGFWRLQLIDQWWSSNLHPTY